MLNLIEKYKYFIKAFHVSQYELEANTYRLKMQLTFLDQSNLAIKEYLFKNKERKYAYHWSDKCGNLISQAAAGIHHLKLRDPEVNNVAVLKNRHVGYSQHQSCQRAIRQLKLESQGAVDEM